MRDRFIAIAALVIMTGFLGILLWKVPRIDLATIIALTLVLASYDFFRTFRDQGK